MEVAYSLLLHALGFFAFAAVVLVLTQDVQIFPGVVLSLPNKLLPSKRTLPTGVVSRFIDTEDGARIEVWRLDRDPLERPLPYVGLVFHGNAGCLEDFLLLQLWFSYLGIPSYSFDYRGYGRSSGWPSERGMYLDSDAVWQHVLEAEDVSAQQVIVMGYSIGGAFAARIASMHDPRLLILLAAFTDIKSVVRATIYAPLERLLWYTLPTGEYISKLENTSLLLAHGERDTVIPPEHCSELEQAYQGNGHIERIACAEADHNMLFYTVREELAARAKRLLGV